ncbi:hypothetical protein PAPYR_8395 [Paratrimastix pyriformis]|uniref:Uncharacterized protein n=1 Tax=Paratrimastix pyriformis TaxID=342808 RepID=A0ABQ8UAM8_9EUKA|nr:hypothetical protein PAPYR_8395 [Paratrimastix pyriformis]
MPCPGNIMGRIPFFFASLAFRKSWCDACPRNSYGLSPIIFLIRSPASSLDVKGRRVYPDQQLTDPEIEGKCLFEVKVFDFISIPPSPFFLIHDVFSSLAQRKNYGSHPIISLGTPSPAPAAPPASLAPGWELGIDAPTANSIPVTTTTATASPLPVLSTLQATLWHHRLVASGCDLMIDGFDRLLQGGREGVDRFMEWVVPHHRELRSDAIAKAVASEQEKMQRYSIQRVSLCAALQDHFSSAHVHWAQSALAMHRHAHGAWCRPRKNYGSPKKKKKHWLLGPCTATHTGPGVGPWDDGDFGSRQPWPCTATHTGPGVLFVVTSLRFPLTPLLQSKIHRTNFPIRFCAKSIRHPRKNYGMRKEKCNMGVLMCFYHRQLLDSGVWSLPCDPTPTPSPPPKYPAVPAPWELDLVGEGPYRTRARFIRTDLDRPRLSNDITRYALRAVRAGMAGSTSTPARPSGPDSATTTPAPLSACESPASNQSLPLDATMSPCDDPVLEHRCPECEREERDEAQQAAASVAATLSGLGGVTAASAATSASSSTCGPQLNPADEWWEVDSPTPDQPLLAVGGALAGDEEADGWADGANEEDEGNAREDERAEEQPTEPAPSETLRRGRLKPGSVVPPPAPRGPVLGPMGMSLDDMQRSLVMLDLCNSEGPPQFACNCMRLIGGLDRRPCLLLLGPGNIHIIDSSAISPPCTPLPCPDARLLALPDTTPPTGSRMGGSHADPLDDHDGWVLGLARAQCENQVRAAAAKVRRDD